MSKMKAIRVEEFGDPEVLEPVEVEHPSPGEGQVLIEVRSAGVNYADTMRRHNQYVEPHTLPFAPAQRSLASSLKAARVWRRGPRGSRSPPGPQDDR